MPKYSYFIFLSACLLSLDCKAQSSSPENVNSKFSFKVTGSKSEGWGYQIYKGEKIIIDQTIIPAISGRNRFATKEDAAKVGELVWKKISKNRGFPSVTVFELDSLKIKY